MKKSLIIKIIAVTAVLLLLGAIAGAVTASAIPDWYSRLTKPSFNPPNWLFAPVWTTLYILMGISAGVVWNEGRRTPGVKKALSIFSIHVVLNFLWSMLFFGLQSPSFALVEILLLLGFILWYTRLFYTIKPALLWLQIPYVLWVTFATVLNGAIVWLN